MPLSFVKPGKRVTLKEIIAGHGLRSHLAAMGMVPGVELEVVSGNSLGPFIVAIKNSRVMLGRGMAAKIFVEQIND